ncbi:hypothetical protein EH105704_16_00140 [Atlantibacter hermannii NBRC 105704]|uniref:Uncharacterized protein n=1 Tax=Atlantibacter hermannii NBRC 105704 TaxID=1115512 RepID=H5V676_ATLHE|nr:hypothetical protein EH105704_16_00140 [Atlantibacter hermannii NBRC 105704]
MTRMPVQVYILSGYQAFFRPFHHDDGGRLAGQMLAPLPDIYCEGNPFFKSGLPF